MVKDSLEAILKEVQKLEKRIVEMRRLILTKTVVKQAGKDSDEVAKLRKKIITKTSKTTSDLPQISKRFTKPRLP